jgi:DNA-binding IclR family transcriptional regulator
MGKPASKPKNEYAIQTVANALRMLEVFHSESEMGVSDLARRLGLHKNKAFRLLATLDLAGYIQQSPETGLYRLGPRCLELGHAFTRNQSLMRHARPILEQLSAEACETAHLATLHDNQVVHLDGIVPSQLVLTGSRVGERLPSHCTALGKALLAGELDATGTADGAEPRSTSAATVHSAAAPHSAATLHSAAAPHSAGALDSPGALDSAAALPSAAALFEQTPLPSFTKMTIVDPMKLIEELRGVQMRGYAVDAEEYATGLSCVAAPVRDATTRVVAALSLSGPSFRLSEDVLHGDVARAVVNAAARLSQELGAPA